MDYSELNLHPDIARAVADANYISCMPVQAATFPHSFLGEDIYAQSQTGTGKTAAFLISIFQRIMTNNDLRHRKALIIAPTRELAVQIEEEAKKLARYLPVSIGCFYGGVSYTPQVDLLRDNVQILIGTPGRIIDLVQQGKMLLREVGFLVVDEADRMFDMGFIDDLRKLLRYLPPPSDRQTFLFSATLNFRIKNLAWEYMSEPKEIVIVSETVTVDLVTQELYHVGAHEKMRVLLGLLAREKAKSALIFCNQKFMAEEVARRLGINGFECEYIMGDLPQAKRLQVINKLKEGKVAILVATDVAARGLDVNALDLVINYDVPMDPESYVHRIGRTARAGASGKAITLACEKFVYGLPAIEKYIETRIPVLPVSEDIIAEDKSAGVRFGHSHDRAKPGERNPRRSFERTSGGKDTRHRDDFKSRGPRPATGRPERQADRPAARAASGDRPNSQGANTQRTAGDTRRTEIRRTEIKGNETRRPDNRQAGRQASPTGKPAVPARAQSGTPAAQHGNPYAVSSEERMRRYKEKYSGPETGAPKQDRAKSGQARRGPAPAAAQGGNRGNHEPKGTAAKKPGILDKLKNLFGKKKKPE